MSSPVSSPQVMGRNTSCCCQSSFNLIKDINLTDLCLHCLTYSSIDSFPQTLATTQTTLVIMKLALVLVLFFVVFAGAIADQEQSWVDPNNPWCSTHVSLCKGLNRQAKPDETPIPVDPNQPSCSTDVSACIDRDPTPYRPPPPGKSHIIMDQNLVGKG